MALNLKLNKMKKISQDANHTTLITNEGHQVKIFHKAISGAHRKALDMLPMSEHGKDPLTKDNASKAKLALASGGEVDTDDSIIAKKAAVDQYNDLHEDEPKEYPQEVEATMQRTDVTPKQKLAKGGNVDPTQRNLLPGDKIPNAIEKQLVNQNRKKLARGGIPMTANSMPGISYMADGGDPAPGNNDIDYSKADYSDDTPYGVSPSQPQTPPNPISAQPDPNQALPVDIPGVTQPQTSQDQSDDDSSQSSQAQGQSSQGLQDATQQPPSQIPEPGALQGYQSQVQGINAQAQAEANLADAKAKDLTTSIAAQQQVANHYQAGVKATNEELAAVRQDIQNTHIDPNHYLGNMSTLGRIGTAIGLFLGGVGGGGRGNQVQDFLNKQIDNDIDAQKANLGKKESIYSGILAQSNNERQATDMTRLIMNDMTLSKLQQAEAQAGSPLAKSRAQQAIGALQTQMAPMIQQQAIYKMALNGGQPGNQSTQGIDPASLVPFMVPQDQQKDVAKEIGQAQNAIKNHDQLMSAFDNATKENTILNRAGHLGYNPASILKMNALELPMIHDQEGRVNEYEQKTLNDLHPLPGDSNPKVAQKRQAYESFIQNKSSAPLAKSHGIDLQNFQSTSTNPELSMTPQQRQMLAIARTNPNHPNAKLIFKKLGVQQ